MGESLKMKLNDIVDILDGLAGTTKKASDMVGGIGDGSATLPSDIANCDENTKTVLDGAKPLLGKAPPAVKEQDLGFDDLKDTVDKAIAVVDKFVSDVEADLGGASKMCSFLPAACK